MKILVVGGGKGGEREVSLRSAKAVYVAIDQKHQKQLYDWDGTEDWLVDNLVNFDLVLPILHGEGGEDGVIQSILENQNKKYLGTDSTASKICIDKQETQRVLANNNILVPGYGALTYEQYIDSQFFQKRHVVKPVNGGSSLDTYIDVRYQDSRLEQIKNSFETYGTMMVEDYISGVEVTVPILEGQTLPLIEIIPPEGEFFDFDNKYNGQTKEICPSTNVSPALQDEAQKLALSVHQTLGCRHLSRVDMIIDEHGQIYTLEINTLPGLTDQSLFPKSAQVAGLSMSDLVEYMIDLVK